MKALREYFKDLGNYGVGPEEAVTELGFDEQASYPKITFRQKGYVPEKALSRVDNLIASDATKVAIRVMEPTPSAGPALAAPAAPALVDDAYEDEAAPAVITPPPVAKAAKPTVTPVKGSDDLAAKLDALFDA
jgi:hypothetical protein